MSEASEWFWRALDRGFMPGDQDALGLYRRAAQFWRQSGRHCNARLAMTNAIHAAWGTQGGVLACAEEALEDFRRCESAMPHCAPESLLSLPTRALALSRYIADIPIS